MFTSSLFFRSAVLVMLLGGIVTSVQAQDLRLATWNIQTLTTGKKVFSNQAFVRAPADLEFLKNFATGIAADVIALQEIASPAALAQVFPNSDWKICIS